MLVQRSLNLLQVPGEDHRRLHVHFALLAGSILPSFPQDWCLLSTQEMPDGLAHPKVA